MRLFRRPELRPPAESAPQWQRPHDPIAYDADILACFRLILGRAPNPEEWHGHAERRGEPLERVVASYLNSHEFAQRGLLSQDHLKDATLSELAAFRIYTSTSDSEIGHSIRHDAYEPEVTAVFRRLLKPG